MVGVSGFRSSEEDQTLHTNANPKEVVSALLDSVIDFRRLEIRKELLSELCAPPGAAAYQEALATTDKILDLLREREIPPEGLAAIRCLLAGVPPEKLEANLLVFRVVEKLTAQGATAQEWALLDSFARAGASCSVAIPDKRKAWAAQELHRQFDSGYETRVGSLPAVLAFLRLQELINLERITDAAVMLATRAKAATNPLQISFGGRDVLVLASMHDQENNPDVLPRSIAAQVMRVFQNNLGTTADFRTTEFALQRMAIALRSLHAIAELYRENGWSLSAVVAGIVEFLKTPCHTTPEALSYESLIGEMAIQRRRIEPLLPLLAYVATKAEHQDRMTQFVSVMDTFSQEAFSLQGGIPHALYRYFVLPQKPQIAHDFIRIAVHLYEFQSQKLDSPNLPPYLSTIERHLTDLHSLNASPVILTGVRKEIQRGNIPSAAEMEKLMRHLVSHAAISVLISAATPEEHRHAGETLNSNYKNDSPPFPYRSERIDPNAQTFLDETFRVIRRGLDHMNGFGSHEFEARRPTREAQSAIEEFLRDSGAQVQRLNCSSNDKFPGSGFVVSGISPTRFLVPDRRNPEDPFALYKAAWPWVGGVIPDLAESTFIACRGFHAVIPPAARRYCLSDNHYSYVVFNSHFENIAQHGALLVPTRLLMQQLNGGTIPIDEYRGFSTTHRDLCTSRLTAPNLLELGEEANLPVLNLSWPSNVGGLMRAFPPNRPPYHQWEASRTTSYRDVAGHVHHSFIEGAYNSNLNSSELRRLLKPLIEAHGMVRDLSENLQALFTLFQYAEAAHSKGQFFPPDANQEEEQHEDDTQDEGDALMNPEAARKIRQSLEWHRRGQTASYPRGSYPVLAIVPSAQLCPSPGQITPILDTVDFSTLVDGKRRFLLRELGGAQDSWEQPSDDEVSRIILKKLFELHPQVAEVYTRMGIRMRLLHRDLVYQSKNPEGGDRHAQSSASP